MATQNNKNLTKTKVENRARAGEIKKKTLFDEFVFWYALPSPEKRNLGIETQGQFAEYHHVAENTLTAWTHRPEFEVGLKILWRRWGKFRTPNIVMAIYNSAVGGGKEAPQAQKLWMQIMEDFSEKIDSTEHQKVEISPNDIRAIVGALPEQYHERFYGYIREIVDVANSERQAGNFNGNQTAPKEDTEATILDDADNDAQNVPDTGSNEVSCGNIFCVSANMERRASTYNYQSTERWW